MLLSTLRITCDLLHTTSLRVLCVVAKQNQYSYHKRAYPRPIFRDPLKAVHDIQPNSVVLIGGFGLCGIPENLIRGLETKGVTGLTIVSNNGGVDGKGIGLLLRKKQVKRMISSYIGENPPFERQYLTGEVEVEFTPQGTLAERVRAGAAGIPAFYTRTGFGTMIHQGGCPVRHDSSGKPVLLSPQKETRLFEGTEYVMETAITGDFALIRAAKADEAGNLVFRKTAQNFNTAMAKAGRITIAEVDEVVPVGSIEPDHIHVPGIFVDRLLTGVPSQQYIERRTVYSPSPSPEHIAQNPRLAARVRIIRRAALEVQHGMYVNLGIGIPTLLPTVLPTDRIVHLHSENGILGVGPYPQEHEVDADLINAGKETITAVPGASYFSSVESFEMIRGGHIDLSFLGAFEVSMYGDLANWTVPGKLIKGMGGGMDLAAAPNTKIVVLMEHTNVEGKPKILPSCNLPLTGVKCVNMIVTDLAVFTVDPHKGLTLIELADGVDLATIQCKTAASFAISKTLSAMKQI